MITIEDLINTGKYEVDITPCSIKDENSSRHRDGMCVNVREWNTAIPAIPAIPAVPSCNTYIIAVAVGHTLDEVMNFIEKQMDQEGLIPLPTR